MKHIINESYSKLLNLMGEIKDLQAASALLSWDQETYMPDGGNQHRSDQLATLETLAHKMLTSDKSKMIVEGIGINTLDETQRAIVDLFKQEYEKALKIPNKLVKALSEARSKGFTSWRKSLETDDFNDFAPALERLVELQKEYARKLGFDNLYDAHLNEYEPGMTTNMLDSMFSELKTHTIELLDQVNQSDKKIESGFGDTKFDRVTQFELFKEISESIGFNYNIGRLDKSLHPFSQAITFEDVRITTRFDESNFLSGLLSTIHESGHGMYEQGISSKLYRTFAAEGASVGIHESQSLIWENIVARSKVFWEWCSPIIGKHFSNTSAFESHDFYQKVNSIQPSYIRTESDELTYNLHIIIRYEIEKELFNGNLKVQNIPDLWSNKMQEYLGIIPDTNKKGCLQDIHWSFGAFGYFPTYTLGKLYSAMMWDTVKQEIPDIETEISRGNFKVLKSWLKINVHQHGKLYKPKDLMKKITGKEISSEPFVKNMIRKISEIYES